MAYMVKEPIKNSKVPETGETALTSENGETWKNAMEEGIKSLNEMNIWELAQLPPDRNMVRSRWVFKAKQNGESVFVRRRARLVGNCFT